jgi:hypothetical protein
MANGSSGCLTLRTLLRTSDAQKKYARYRGMNACKMLGLLAAAVLLAQMVFAQARPHVTAVDPQTGKASDNMTLMGENLGKDGVVAVYLSDDTTDHEAMVVEQAADKIVAKVPKVKAGSYNVSIKVGDQIFILPLRFVVQE